MMNRQILLAALLGAGLALSAGGVAAQAPATSNDPGAKSTTQPGTSAQPMSSAQQQQPSTHSKHAKTKKSSSHKTKTKSTQHAAKSKSAKAKTTGESTSPAESPYRQALRGCVAQKDESQRDSCIDHTIEKFGRNA